MNNQTIKTIIPLLAVLLVQLACELPVLSTPASSNPEPASIETIIAGTAAAAQTQTALALPSPTETPTITPQPTETPTETPTPTATVIFIIPTSTKPFEPHSAGSQCNLDAMEPYNPIVDPGTSISIKWTIRNTSADVWLESNIDFRHTGGKDMHKTDIYDLPVSVPPNGSVNLIVPMVAPKESGHYTTTWKLMMKKKALCTLSATVIVK